MTDMLPPIREPVVRAADVHRVTYRDSDRDLFRTTLYDFVPPNAFDAHAHLYDLRHLVCDREQSFAGPPSIDHETLVKSMRQWMGDRVASDGLYFGFPVAGLDCVAANEILADSICDRRQSRGLMIIRPNDDPAEVESILIKHNFAGFKVYHVFADRPDTFNAEQIEFLPEWAWDLANQHSLAIMMHMVLPRALADTRNQHCIVRHCVDYPNAKLILAHAARGFNASHTVEGIDSLRGLANVWFDTSAVCEAAAFEAIIDAFGTTRLMYGSDFPVSEMRGRCVSIGDGFHWLHDYNADWNDAMASPQLVGIESLLALRQACRNRKLIDRDVENIFGSNAKNMLGIAEERERTRPDVQSLYRTAKTVIPGGTQLLSKRPEMFAPDVWPAYYEQAIGCEVIDSDGRRYIDMSHCGILSTILGFADPDVNAAVIRRIQLGSMATLQTSDEVELARLLTEIHPWADQARFTRSGGEAMAVAIRIARAATGRSKLAVCGYHGWHDWYLAANLQSTATNSAAMQLDAHLLPGLEPVGVPNELAGTVSTFQYNRLDQLDAAIGATDGKLAAIVMEPTRGVDPADGFLEGVRERADKLGAALIFDEISSGWRLCLGGAHRLFGVDPDIAVFAKGMSNGFPMGAVIGRSRTMRACEGSFISSTFWTEGVGPAAAIASIKKMQRIDVPAHLKRLGLRVMNAWKQLGEKHHLPVVVSGRPAAAALAFDHADNAALLTLMTTRMLECGFLASANCSLTLAHKDHHIDRYVEALDVVFSDLATAIACNDVHGRLRGPVKHYGFRRLAD
ncbi:MAG: aminotransferase class III-fold pyridoxal phosphate-dependent enzyme [Planctomycetales bacterium]|nr:aminotransferase class III-fold pyridoxal phosphate-dependent enzyme [Planctomycetales bacterium]